MRLRASPHAIALGLSFGVFTSCTPFMGLHIALALGLAYLFRGNLIAAALGTAVGNPVTFPIIWISIYNLGSQFLDPAAQTLPNPQPFSIMGLFSGPFDQALPIVGRMVLGSLPIGILASILCYLVTRSAVQGFQLKRRKRLAKGRRRPLKSSQLVTPTLS